MAAIHPQSSFRGNIVRALKVVAASKSAWFFAAVWLASEHVLGVGGHDIPVGGIVVGLVLLLLSLLVTGSTESTRAVIAVAGPHAAACGCSSGWWWSSSPSPGGTILPFTKSSTATRTSRCGPRWHNGAVAADLLRPTVVRVHPDQRATDDRQAAGWLRVRLHAERIPRRGSIQGPSANASATARRSRVSAGTSGTRVRCLAPRARVRQCQHQSCRTAAGQSPSPSPAIARRTRVRDPRRAHPQIARPLRGAHRPHQHVSSVSGS